MLDGLPRRSTAIAAGVLLLSGALSSCGFDYATNRVNTISSGVNDQSGEIDILGAAVISGAPNSGLFVATLSNPNPTEPISLVGLAGEAPPADDLAPVEIAPLGSVSLYQSGGVALSGQIGLGDFITVELSFDNGQTSTVQVAVMRPCYEYDPAKFPGMVLPGASTADPAVESDAAGEATSGATDPYSCTPITAEPQGEGE